MLNLTDYKIRGRRDIILYDKIVLFGAGNYILESIEAFDRKRIIAILDNDPNKWGQEIEGLKVQAPKHFFKKEVDRNYAVVLSTSGYQYEIVTDLVTNGWICKEQLFSLCPDYQEDKMYRYKDIFNHLELIEKAYELFEDEESKAYYLNSLIARITHQPLYLMPNKNMQQPYCYSGKKMICPSSGDYVLDCGAYIGDTAQIFIKMMKNKGIIYCLEPFEGNFARLDQWVKKSRLGKIVKPYQVAVSNRDENMIVSAGNQVSMRANIRVCENEKNEVYVSKIDNMQGDIFEKVDFIKMDVEGEEMNALDGARHTIATYKPRMMISAYHETKHLWEIPLRIKEILPEYKIFLGHQPSVSFEPEIYVSL